MTLSDRERQVMQHALGLDQSLTPYRNHFCAGHADTETWDGLVARGLATRREEGDLPHGAFITYHVTDAGRTALGPFALVAPSRRMKKASKP